MNTRNFLYCIVAFIIVAAQTACNQPEPEKIYTNKLFSITYPADWQRTKENDILNFFSKEKPGVVTVSINTGVTFPMEMTREFVLDMNKVKDKPENVMMSTNGDATEFRYEHVDGGIKWVTKVVRKGTDLYVVSINCDEDKWETNKATLLKVFDSFKLN